MSASPALPVSQHGHSRRDDTEWNRQIRLATRGWGRGHTWSRPLMPRNRHAQFTLVPTIARSIRATCQGRQAMDNYGDYREIWPPFKADTPALARTGPGRAYRALGIGFAIALLVANTAGAGYLVVREQADSQRITQLSGDLAAADSKVQQLKTSVASAQHEASNAKTLAESAKAAAGDAGDRAATASETASKAAKAQEQAKAAALDTNAVVEKVKSSVVTVHCGDALGSGFAIDAGAVA